MSPARPGETTTAYPASVAVGQAAERGIGPVGFFAVAVVSLGGPLALAAKYAPGLVGDAAGSAGLITVAAGLAFLFPLVIWLRYARHVAGPAGLAGFVEQAAGRRLALVQAAVWMVSYALYLLYTSVYVVYDVLPSVLPGVRPYQSVLEVLLPAAVAAVVLAPRRVTIGVIGGLAAAQLALVALLAGLAIGHGAPVSAFGMTAPAGTVAAAGGNVALLYVCGSLPLFLGGEVARPARTIRRGLVAAYAVVAVGVVLAGFPLAVNPAFTRVEVPGASLAASYAGRGAGVAVGLGVAASIVGVMVVEYVAVTRLAHALAGVRVQSVARVLAVAMVAGGLVSLVDPERFYAYLLRPSLVALWVSQLIVVAVYPLFARRRGRLRPTHVALAAGASALMLFGLYSSVVHQVAT